MSVFILLISIALLFLGALRNDFFEKYLEGAAERRLPRKHWALEHDLEMTGKMIAHSIVQGGQSFSLLCPAVYKYIISLDRDEALAALPLSSDIPMNASTSTLFDLLSEVCFIYTHVSACAWHVVFRGCTSCRSGYD